MHNRATDRRTDFRRLTICVDKGGPFYYPSQYMDTPKRGEEMEEDWGQETSLGMYANIEALLCYSFGWVTAIIFLVMEKKSSFVRFHAVQSLVAFVGLTVALGILVMIPRWGAIAASLLWFAGVALWAALMWKAYRGEWFKLPLIGQFARNLAGRR